ncbi:MAG: hypothetical protein WCI72_00990 [archaeon]
MEDPKPIYLTLEQITSVADDYIALDSKAQMKTRNGMPSELYINCHILNCSINMNELAPQQDELGGYTQDSLIGIAKSCAPHYGRTPEDLVSAFNRCMGLEFYDADRRADIERQWAELLSS